MIRKTEKQNKQKKRGVFDKKPITHTQHTLGHLYTTDSSQSVVNNHEIAEKKNTRSKRRMVEKRHKHKENKENDELRMSRMNGNWNNCNVKQERIVNGVKKEEIDLQTSCLKSETSNRSQNSQNSDNSENTNNSSSIATQEENPQNTNKVKNSGDSINIDGFELIKSDVLEMLIQDGVDAGQCSASFIDSLKKSVYRRLTSLPSGLIEKLSKFGLSKAQMIENCGIGPIGTNDCYALYPKFSQISIGYLSFYSNISLNDINSKMMKHRIRQINSLFGNKLIDIEIENFYNILFKHNIIDNGTIVEIMKRLRKLHRNNVNTRQRELQSIDQEYQLKSRLNIKLTPQNRFEDKIKHQLLNSDKIVSLTCLNGIKNICTNFTSGTSMANISNISNISNLSNIAKIGNISGGKNGYACVRGSNTMDSIANNRVKNTIKNNFPNIYHQNGKLSQSQQLSPSQLSHLSNLSPSQLQRLRQLSQVSQVSQVSNVSKVSRLPQLPKLPHNQIGQSSQGSRAGGTATGLNLNANINANINASINASINTNMNGNVNINSNLSQIVSQLPQQVATALLSLPNNMRQTCIQALAKQISQAKSQSLSQTLSQNLQQVNEIEKAQQIHKLHQMQQSGILNIHNNNIGNLSSVSNVANIRNISHGVGNKQISKGNIHALPRLKMNNIRINNNNNNNNNINNSNINNGMNKNTKKKKNLNDDSSWYSSSPNDSSDNDENGANGGKKRQSRFNKKEAPSRLGYLRNRNENGRRRTNKRKERESSTSLILALGKSSVPAKIRYSKPNYPIKIDFAIPIYGKNKFSGKLMNSEKEREIHLKELECYYDTCKEDGIEFDDNQEIPQLYGKRIYVCRICNGTPINSQYVANLWKKRQSIKINNDSKNNNCNSNSSNNSSNDSSKDSSNIMNVFIFDTWQECKEHYGEYHPSCSVGSKGGSNKNIDVNMKKTSDGSNNINKHRNKACFNMNRFNCMITVDAHIVKK